MVPSKSGEHRRRVLENQQKIAAEKAHALGRQRGDTQMHIPLIVEVKSGPQPKQRPKRSRSRPGAQQPKLGGI